MRLMVFVFLVFYAVCANSHDDKKTEPLGFYWRDFVGEVPYDAVPGGTEKTGNPTYIGQVYIKNFELLPATITYGSTIATASAYNKMMQTDQNIKILCSSQPEKLAWVVTKSEEAHLITNCHLVVGGSEVNEILHVGRVNYDGRTVIGKVFSYRPGSKGLWIPHKGHEVHFTSYEILTYNCNK